MSEEKQEGGVLSNLKAQIATGAGVILTGIGTMFDNTVDATNASTDAALGFMAFVR